ncbi:hypothetical protein Droror1_Dr00020064 [Drosera rotundifolia]
MKKPRSNVVGATTHSPPQPQQQPTSQSNPFLPSPSSSQPQPRPNQASLLALVPNHTHQEEEELEDLDENGAGVAENGEKGGGDGEEESEEEEGEGDEEEYEEEEEAVVVEEERVRPKLDEGFYEIEAIRKKRIFKGEPQYLIKWRGWPESSNTWEPLEHLQTCPDVVEAFEERQSAQKKTYRKRKRKFTQPKKKMQYSYGGSRNKVASMELSLRDKIQSSDDISNLNSANSEPPLSSSNGIDADYNVEINEPALVRKDNLEGARFFHTVQSRDGNQVRDSEQKNVNANNLTVQFQQSASLDRDDSQIGHSKTENKEPSQIDRCTGAKRRKCGSVRRFKQEMPSLESACPQNPKTVGITSCDRNARQLVSLHNNFDCNASVITKIIKPIGYSASVTNNVHDISVTFMALRADGKEVMVDNQFLKANNPLLLINFYEQHLRYNPTS